MHSQKDSGNIAILAFCAFSAKTQKKAKIQVIFQVTITTHVNY
jgi:hypothetical protein